MFRMDDLSAIVAGPITGAFFLAIHLQNPPDTDVLPQGGGWQPRTTVVVPNPSAGGQ